MSRARAKIVAEHAFKFFYYMLTLFCAVATDVRGVIRLAMPKAAAQPFTCAEFPRIQCAVYPSGLIEVGLHP